MKTILLSILFFFSGLFVHHPQTKTMSIVPKPTANPMPTALPSVTPIPTAGYDKEQYKPIVTPIPSNCICTPNNCTCTGIEVPAKKIPGCTENCRPVPTQTMQQQINEMQSEIQQMKDNQ